MCAIVEVSSPSQRKVFEGSLVVEGRDYFQQRTKQAGEQVKVIKFLTDKIPEITANQLANAGVGLRSCKV